MSDLPLQEIHPTPSTLNLILTGFMGTGKTTVGALVAAHMGRVFYDMDAVIEQRTGMAITGIFAQESEPYFRAIERGLCYEMALQQNLVVATGGGALVDTNNYEVMSKTGVIICLTADAETLTARLGQTEGRPLASRWQSLLEERLPFYDAMAYQVDTSGRSPEQVAADVMILWNMALTNPNSPYSVGNDGDR
jgi:shikimate kinase